MLQRPVAEAASRRPGRTGKTQLKLFNAAMDIMTEKGLEYATVEEVAARAGVSKGTVYYNFGSKKTMVDQLVQYGTQLLLSDAARRRPSPTRVRRCGVPFVPRFSTSRTARALPGCGFRRPGRVRRVGPRR